MKLKSPILQLHHYILLLNLHTLPQYHPKINSDMVITILNSYVIVRTSSNSKHLAHSLNVMRWLLSKSQSSKNGPMQCSRANRGARIGNSSWRDTALHITPCILTFKKCEIKWFYSVLCIVPQYLINVFTYLSWGCPSRSHHFQIAAFIHLRVKFVSASRSIFMKMFGNSRRSAKSRMMLKSQSLIRLGKSARSSLVHF